MTKITSLRGPRNCAHCGEELIAPDRSTFVSEARVCHCWVCAHCGDEFETYSVLTALLAPKIVEAHLPTVLVAGSGVPCDVRPSILPA